ncbi:orotidine-5'-phosphate decarboxylase [Puniceicoccales bacterium CK1056]|uniref:Orotidine 5'-phosphate decarboxylase n=1 Tax=Oceanipulchritudo coccoides TaxID=2706888 RepID=A0A6B2LWL9_9BACT|nr:orotidine-5'-phosphate decarboxylase [Oceanipulchritudo coccoides]NDV60878.1 orotidine-5'-phosphate decarboxylase [Oceanipulchritudo coccoides]
MTFITQLQSSWESTASMVCVGLDPQMDRLPASIRTAGKPFLEFNKRIIDATLPYACAYKPQFAYFAAENRLDELLQTMDYLREVAPGRIVILDAKRGDIGSTADQYAREAFEFYKAHAVTVNPYMGGDTLLPFTRFAEKGVVVLCKTSNPGSAELQDLILENGDPLYLEVAKRAARDWNANRNLCLVVGATYPKELARIRESVGEMPLLVPGIGAQGGDLEATLRAGLRADGWGLLINSSRGILYASSGDDFAEAAGAAARELQEACLSFQKNILQEAAQ